MLFLNRVGPSTTGIPTYPVSNLQISNPAVELPSNNVSENYDQYFTDEESKRPKRTLRKLGGAIVTLCSGVIGGGIIAYTLTRTPGTYKIIQKIDGHPAAARLISNDIRNNLHSVPIDSFVSNYRNFENIYKAISDGKINPPDLDLNKNNIILDTKEEIQKLITIFKSIDKNKFKTEISLLEEINITSQLIWGRTGPTIYVTNQGNRPNCQVMGAIHGHFTTYENIQNIKSKIHVLNFNPSPDNFRIDTIVEVNGKSIFVPYEALEDWITLKGAPQSSARDGSLSVPILTYAIEKKAKDYGGVPNTLPSVPITLLSGKNYGFTVTETLSDIELINILNKAPNTPTLVGTFRQTRNNSSIISVFQDAINYWTKSSSTTSTKSSPSHFTQNLFSTFEQIKSDKTPNYYFNYTNSYGAKDSNKSITPNHIYTVKDFKKVDSKYIATIVDSHGMEHDLTLDQIRKCTDIIITDSQNIPLIGNEGSKAILWSLITLFLICKATKSWNKIILPDEKKTEADSEVLKT